MSKSGIAAIAALVAAMTPSVQAAPATTTPIKHLVVIFQENVSFDHYFATYPNAANPADEPAFHAAPGTPTVNGLSGSLLASNPNRSNPQNGVGAVNPFRLDRSQAATASQDHDYGPEQAAFHAGLMDLFPMSVGRGNPSTGAAATEAAANVLTTTGLVMGYYDGNTVTALWDYAQHFAMSDNFYGTTFGPSTVGALNLVSGQTHGVTVVANGSLGDGGVADGAGGTTLIGDPQPLHDVCSTREQVAMGGRNIGDLLNGAQISWGWFEGGFDLAAINPNGTTGCKRSSPSVVTGQHVTDYIPHHQPFQYYASTANPNHLRPGSIAGIGHRGDPANHQYDLEDFYRAVRARNFPAVSFLKAPGAQNGHSGYSTPLDEQAFIVHVINFLQATPEWKDTAIVITWDDSDGWYDHQMPPIVNQSSSSADALTGAGACGDGRSALPGIADKTAHAQGRCGYGPRLPLLIVSPWARRNAVDHTVTDQTSILRFVEDNWLHGQRIGHGSFDALANPLDGMFDFRTRPAARDARRLFLSETTGQRQADLTPHP